MNNKPLILALSILFAVAVIGFSIYGLFSPGNRLKVVLPEDVDAIVINDRSVENGKSLAIKPGEYTYTLEGDNIDNSRRDITIKPSDNDIVISYAPYSRAHLNQMLQSQESEIRSLMTREYTSKTENYRIQKMQLLDRGQYAAVLMAPSHVDVDNPVNVYRTILQKSGESWQVTAGPELLLTTTNTRDIEKHILQEVNNLAL